MSLSDHRDEKATAAGGAAAGGAAAQAPKLRNSASYASWRPDMEVWLERYGAKGVHLRALTPKQWERAAETVQRWEDEAVDAALAHYLGDDAPRSSSSSSSSSGSSGGAKQEKGSGDDPDAEARMRKELTALVERSTRVYGVIYGAMPDDLRKQAESVARGHANGLWKWLETKLQSTEQDSVGALLEQWVALAQDEDEPFDAYRARVNRLRTLLEHAKEKPSGNMYSLMLLDRLQPRYKAAVLVLKAGGQLKDPEAADWDAIAALLNRHEREEVRSGDMVNAAWAHAARGRAANAANTQQRQPQREASSSGGGERGPPEWLAKRECFNCHKLGHSSKFCKEPRRERGAAPRSDGGGRSKSDWRGGSGGGGGDSEREQPTYAAVAVKSDGGRFSALSSEDEEDGHDEQSGQRREGVRALYSVVAAGQQVAMAGRRIATIAQREAESAAAKAAAKEKEKAAAKEKEKAERAREAAAARMKEATAQQSAAAKAKPRTYAQLDDALTKKAWGVDTMASVCISGNRDCFATLRKVPAVQIKTADGSIVTAVHSGTVALRITLDDGRNVKILVDNVLYHERFTANLLSCERLTKMLGWEYHSNKEETYMLTPGRNRVTLSHKGRISVLLGASPERVYAALTPGAGVRDDVPTVEALVRLHERLGHMPFNQLIQLLREGSVDGLGKVTLNSRDIDSARLQVRECRACIRGKQTRTQFDHRGVEKGNRPAEIVHMDTYVVKCSGADGQPMQQYGLSIMDTFTREGWHARVFRKDQVADAVIAQLRLIERHTGQRVKRIHSDGGSEFMNQTLKNWLAKEGIVIRPSPPHTQQLNGVAERSIRTFKDAGRTLMLHAHAPTWLWHEAIGHAVWISNRTKVASGTRKTPYELGTGRLPCLKERKIGVWGCDCFVHQRKELRDGAMAAKSEPGIYLGHSEETNAPTVLMLRTGKRVVTRDVRFLNSSFAHMRALKAGDDAVAAVLDGTSDLLASEADSAEDLGSQPEDMPAQGGRAQPNSGRAGAGERDAHSGGAASDAESGSDDDQWVVDRILQRRVVRGNIPQYKVRWAGFGEADDSWEPEENVSDCAAFDDFMEARATAAPAGAAEASAPRRSPRFASGSAPERDDDDRNDEQLQVGRVEMAMAGLRALATTDEWPDDYEVVMNAVAAGVGAGASPEASSDVAGASTAVPASVEEAQASPEWQAARKKEYDSLIAKGVWEEVQRASLPKGTQVLPYKEVYKVKLDEHGAVADHKARFTIRGDRQRRSPHQEVFARTPMYKTGRLALSLAARFGSELVQFDVPTAFLNADVEEEVFMEMPKGFGREGMVCRLKKSLYGLRSAPRSWEKLIHGFITKEMGWKATVSDPSFYFKRSRTGQLMLIYRFVDDLQAQHRPEDAAEFEESAGMLRERFNIKKMQSATWMLGMEVAADRKAGTIRLTQRGYFKRALERYGLAQCKVVSSPEVPGASTASGVPELDAPADRQRYMEMVGTLMYGAISTRPDIAHAVHYLASNMLAPTTRHMQAAERVFRYVAGTLGVGLVFGARNGSAFTESRGRSPQVQLDVCAFADADWANNKGDRKSISGWVAKINGDPVSWSSKKQRVVALSTCEAELYAEAAAIQEVLWLRGMLAELGLHVATGSTVYGDNQSTIAVSKNGVKGERTKHVDVKYHFITETIESGKVKLQWVQSSEQQADIFTKALPLPTFLKLRKDLMTE